MKSANRTVGRLSLLVLYGAATTVSVGGQSPIPINRGPDPQSQIQHMTGTWQVRQRMWPGPGTEPLELPPAIAHRRVIGNALLEEEMELAPGAHGEPFTRIAYFNYNPVGKQYEYFSIDTRAPQMMRESSCETVTQNKLDDQKPVSLCGGIFVAPKWGKAINAAFRYRLVMIQASPSQQVVRLYLTPVSGEMVDEFLAYEYVYSH
jgi:hypothetical protein